MLQYEWFIYANMFSFTIQVWLMNLMCVLLLICKVEVIENLKKWFLKSEKLFTLLRRMHIHPNILWAIEMKFAAKQIVNFDSNK